MADSVLKSYLVSLGFQVKGGSEFKRSLKDYEAAVVAAEKAIEDARWAGATTQEEIAKLTREKNLKLAREALAKAQETKKAEDELAKKRKADTEAMIKGFEKLAIAALAAATAIGYAMSKITGAFDNLYYQSERAGTSVQSLKAIGYAFSQTGGSAQQAQASIDSFTAKIRNNPGLNQFVKELGVDPRLGGVDKYIATLDAIKAKTKDAPFIGVQYAEMLGISEENYNQFVRQGEAIKAYKAQYDGLLKSFGLDTEKAAASSVAFERAFGKLRATVSILAEKLLSSLAPAITAIVDQFQAWAEANPGALDKILTNISNAIIRVAEGIAKFIASITGDDGDGFIKKWDAFVVRVEKFAAAIERVVYGVERLLKLFHLLDTSNTVLQNPDRTIAALNAISGGTAAPNGPGGANTGNAVPPDDRSFLQKVLPKALGGRDAPQAGDGSRAWRNNNPGNIKMGPLARSLGATEADDKGFAKFPSYEAGRKAQEKLLFEGKNYKDKTILEAIRTWAPRSDGNDPEGYAKILAEAAGVGVDTPLASLDAEQRGRLLDAQQRKEGWTPGRRESAAGADDAPAPAGTPRITSGLTTITTKSGRSFRVASQFAENFRGFLDDYEKAGGKIGSASGGLNERPGNASYHPVGRAIDVNQIGRGVRSKDQNLDPATEDALAAKWGLRSGNSFRNNDQGHFEVHRAADAAAALERIAREKGGIPANVPKAGGATTPNMTPGGFDPNSIKPSTPAGIGPGASSTSTATDNRAVHQTFHSNTTVTGVERPADHAAVLGRVERDNHALALQNAQSAIA